MVQALRVRPSRDAAERASWDGLMEAHHTTIWGFAAPSGRRCSAGRRGVQGRGAEALAGLAAGAAVPASAPDCRQHAVSGFAGFPGSEPGVACSGPVVGHGGAAGASGSFGGDLRGPGPVRGDLLPGGGLDGDWRDAGLWPGRGRLAGARSSEEGSGASAACAGRLIRRTTLERLHRAGTRSP